MASRVSRAVSATVFCAILVEDDKDIKLNRVERTQKKIKEIINRHVDL